MYEFGIIGAGNMAEAIVTGLLARKVLTAQQIVAANPNEARLAEFVARTGVARAVDNKAVAAGARVVLLSTKPGKIGAVLDEIAAAANAEAVFVSVATGVSLEFMESKLGPGRRVIRTMPNTPMAVGEGAVGLARGTQATDADVALVRRFFEACAEVVEVPEAQMDAVTAVSGSGPAYFFLLVEQMIRAGVELGLTPEQARSLAAKTALGAGKMLTESPDISPEEFRRRVTSPNGTTHAAITTMQAAGLERAIFEGIKAAAARAKELSV
jgi:pyrroline-5-carboxylate reductase